MVSIIKYTNAHTNIDKYNYSNKIKIPIEPVLGVRYTMGFGESTNKTHTQEKSYA